jgi:hypothetical protein
MVRGVIIIGMSRFKYGLTSVNILDKVPNTGVSLFLATSKHHRPALE